MNTVPASAAEYDSAMRSLAEQTNLPVLRLSGAPLSPYADRPILVFGDQTKAAGFDYRLTTPSPIRNGHEGLVAETLYSTLGEYVADSRDGEGNLRKGTFSFWETDWTSPEGVTRPGSQIAAQEIARLKASRQEPYRGMHPLIFDTPRTLDRVIEAMRENIDPLGRVAARVLTFGKSFAYSPNVVVLTRFAATRFYIPDGLPSNSLATWTAAFQISRVSPPDDMMAVWDRLTSTNKVPSVSAKIGDTIYKTSQKALFFSSIASGPFAIKANAQCEAASAALGMLETLDPNLRDRSRASGDLITGDLTSVNEEEVEVRMTSPVLKVKKGDRLSIRLDDGSMRTINSTISAVRVGHDDGITLFLTPAVPKKRTREGKVVAIERVWTKPELDELVHGQDRRTGVALTKTLMSPNASRMERKRWIKNTPRERVGRQMPYEVAVAAAGR